MISTLLHSRVICHNAPYFRVLMWFITPSWKYFLHLAPRHPKVLGFFPVLFSLLWWSFPISLSTWLWWALELLLFSSYIHSLGDLIQPLGIKYHQYADHSQIHISSPDFFLEFQVQSFSCLFDISYLMFEIRTNTLILTFLKPNLWSLLPNLLYLQSSPF